MKSYFLTNLIEYAALKSGSSFDSTQLNKSIFKDLQFSKTTKNPPLCILDPWPQKLIRWEHFKYYSKCCTFLLLVFVITFLRIVN